MIDGVPHIASAIMLADEWIAPIPAGLRDGATARLAGTFADGCVVALLEHRNGRWRLVGCDYPQTTQNRHGVVFSAIPPACAFGTEGVPAVARTLYRKAA